MIGYDRLGNNGRFGNQLFQYAALRGIAEKHGYDWCIPPAEHPNQANYGIHDAFVIDDKNIGFINSNVSTQAQFSYENICHFNPNTKNVMESSFEFDEDLFNNFEDNTNLDGYLQSFKYFEHIREQLLDELSFRDEILNPCKEFISQYGKIIFLHVRRGDCTRTEQNVKMYPPITMEYYEEALKYFDDDTYVFVSSDEVEWCKEQKLFSGDRFLIRDEVEKYSHTHKEGDGTVTHSCIPYTDLCLMSLCQGAILARSTFSWWGGWMIRNPTLPIIAPKPFQYYNVHYGIDSSSVDESFLIPNTWTTVSKGVYG